MTARTHDTTTTSCYYNHLRSLTRSLALLQKHRVEPERRRRRSSTSHSRGRGRSRSSRSRSRIRSRSRSRGRRRDSWSRSPPPRHGSHHRGHPLAAAHEWPEVCRDFQRGLCTRGGTCRFSHQGNISQRKHDFGLDEVCRDFQAGRCKREHCRYSHDGAGGGGGGGGGGGKGGSSRRRERGGGEGRGESIRDRFNVDAGTGDDVGFLGSCVSEIDNDKMKSTAVVKENDRYARYHHM